ncbi:stage II sporulation protein P [Paenibacillus glucanolyticus]|uniref:stage II sporulation protein P n=2 Tax=Paenibacillus glucanolyticus TaxID=59843 RepID=UPI0036A4CF0E
MNNRKFRIWNIARLKRKVMEGLSMGRTLVILMLGSLIFFILLGLGGMAEQRMNSSPVSSMKGLAASLSSHFFIDMIGMEMPHMTASKETSSFSGDKMSTFVFELLTSVNPKDPKSLLAGELPGMKANQPVQLSHGSGNEDGEAPADYRPDPAAEQPEENPGDTGEEPPQGEQGDNGIGGEDGPDQGAEEEPGSKNEPGNTSKDGKTTGGKKAVLIYHSHPQEAYNPLLTHPSDNPGAVSPSKNVMLVGSFLSKRLEANGIGTLHDKSDYQSTVPGYNYNYSYKYSRQMVMEAMSQNDGINYLIDIHRDSQRYNKTTATVNGLNYAKVYFIIGHANENWRKNEEFASKINAKLEKSYPGVSRGVWGKSADQGNGEYNQSLSPNSILIEIGGIDNTKEELQRTSEALADIIADVYWQEQEAKKASVKKDSDPANKRAASAPTKESGTADTERKAAKAG